MRGCRWAVRTSLLAATLLATVSCGVPLEDSPRAIAQTSTTQTTVPRPATGTSGKTVDVYYLLDNRLTAVEVAASDDPTAAEAVGLVLRPPVPPYKSPIPANTQLLDFSITDFTAIIDLSKDINDIEAEGQKAAYAQLVFTALESGEARRVTFEVAGQTVNVATDNGNLQIITASDYDASFRPAN